MNKITDLRTKTGVFFSDLDLGECYMIEDELYMKIGNNKYVRLISGITFDIKDAGYDPNTLLVNPVNVEFVIHSNTF